MHQSHLVNLVSSGINVAPSPTQLKDHRDKYSSFFKVWWCFDASKSEPPSTGVSCVRTSFFKDFYTSYIGHHWTLRNSSVMHKPFYSIARHDLKGTSADYRRQLPVMSHESNERHDCTAGLLCDRQCAQCTLD